MGWESERKRASREERHTCTRGNRDATSFPRRRPPLPRLVHLFSQTRLTNRFDYCLGDQNELTLCLGVGTSLEILRVSTDDSIRVSCFVFASLPFRFVLINHHLASLLQLYFFSPLLSLCSRAGLLFFSSPSAQQPPHTFVQLGSHNNIDMILPSLLLPILILLSSSFVEETQASPAHPVAHYDYKSGAMGRRAHDFRRAVCSTPRFFSFFLPSRRSLTFVVAVLLT